MDISQDLITVPMKDLAHGANYMAHFIDKHLEQEHSSETITYIDPSDFRYYILQTGAMKSEHPLLMFSARNAPSNNIALFKEAECEALFYAAPLSRLVDNLAANLPGLRIFAAPSLEEMLQRPAERYPYSKT
jgi:hypothetical protein